MNIISRSLVLASLLYSVGVADSAVSFTSSPSGYIKDKVNNKVCISNFNLSAPTKPFVDFNYSYDNNGTWYSANGIANCVSLSPFSDGTHSVTVFAWSSDYNSSITNTYSANTTSNSFIIDTVYPATAPMTFGVSGANSTTDSNKTIYANSNEINISLTSPLSNSDVVYYRYQLDSKISSKELNATNQNISFSNLGTGTHTLYIWAKDLAGNEQPDANKTTITIYVDSTPPTISSINYEAYTLKNVLELNVSTDENISSYKYDVNGTGFSAETSLNPTIKSFNISHPITSSGEYNVTILVKDLYGNWSEQNKTISIKADRSSASSYILGLNPESVINVGAFSVYPYGERITQFKYKLNDGDFSSYQNIGNPISVANYPSNVDYNLTVTFKDFDGTESSKVIKWSKKGDTNNSITFSNLPAFVSTTNSINVGFSGVSGANYSYYVDDVLKGTVQSAGNIVESGLVHGEHNISVVNFDNNKSVYKFYVDSTAISENELKFISNVDKDGITKDNTLNLKVYGKDAVSYMYKLNNQNWSTETALATAISLNGLGSTNYYQSVTSNTLPNFGSTTATTQNLYQEMISIKVKDSVGNWGNPVVFGYYIDETNPTLTITKVDENATHTIMNVKSSSDDGRYMQYSLNNNTYSNWLSLNSTLERNVTFENLADGLYTFKAKVKDVSGRESSEQSKTFSVGSGVVPEVALSFVASQVGNLPNIGNSVYVGYPVTFDVNDSALSSFSWNFGDGTTSTSKKPTKTYSSAGTYTVTFTGIYSNGTEVQNSTTVTVANVSGTSSSYIPSSTAQSSSTAGGSVIIDTPSYYSSYSSIASSSSAPSGYSINGSYITFNVINAFNLNKVNLNSKEALEVLSGSGTFNMTSNTPLAVGSNLISALSNMSVAVIAGSYTNLNTFTKSNTTNSKVVITPTNGKVKIENGSTVKYVEQNQTAIFENGILKYIAYSTPSNSGNINDIQIGGAFDNTAILTTGLNIYNNFIPDIVGNINNKSFKEGVEKAISNEFGLNYKLYQSSNGIVSSNDMNFVNLSMLPLGHVMVDEQNSSKIEKNRDATITVYSNGAKVKMVPSIFDLNSFKSKYTLNSVDLVDNHYEFTYNNQRVSLKANPIVGNYQNSSYSYTTNNKTQYLYPAIHNFNEFETYAKSLFGSNISIEEGFKGSVKIGNETYKIEPILTTQNINTSSGEFKVKFSDGYYQKFIKETK